MYHLAEVRWQQGQREAAAKLVEQSLEIMETQVGEVAWSHYCTMYVCKPEPLAGLNAVL